MTGIYNINAQINSSLSLLMTWKDSNGNPVNLTGYTAKMDVRQTKDSPSALLELTTVSSPSNLTLGGTDGTVTIFVAVADAQGLEPGTYVYDLILISASGTAYRFIEGQYIQDNGVTKPIV